MTTLTLPESQILDGIAVKPRSLVRLVLDQRDQLEALERERRCWFDAWGIATRDDWTQVVDVARRLDALEVEIVITERLIELLRTAVRAAS